LIRHITVRGLFPSLPPFVCLVDTPGSNDLSAKRADDKRFSAFLAGSKICYVSKNSRAAATEVLASDFKMLATINLLKGVQIILTHFFPNRPLNDDQKQKTRDDIHKRLEKIAVPQTSLISRCVCSLNSFGVNDRTKQGMIKRKIRMCLKH
jgi:hypothetical protein